MLMKSLIPGIIIGLWFIPLYSQGENKYSVKSGSWQDASLWLPAGIPAANDVVHIMNGHTVITASGNINVQSLYIRPGGKLLLTAGTQLHLSSVLEVNGELQMNQGDIQAAAGMQFILGDSSVFIWEPGNNTPSGASLFINGMESFSPFSTLIIKRWYDYTVPLATDISSHFGNLHLHSLSGNLIFEWNQNNLFNTHRIEGTLTIGKAWITLDKSGSSDTVFIKRIRLENTNSYLDLHGGDHPSTLTVITDEIYNYGGEINGIYNGNGNIRLVVNGDLTNFGYIFLIRNSGLSGIGNGNAMLQVNGKLTQHAGDFRGIFNLTSFQSGTVDFRINQLNLYGGIFLAQYACHTGNGINRFEINGDLNIGFTQPQNKFRISGLTSLAGIFNAARTEFIVHGMTSINGHAQAEITTSGATGMESLQANNDFEVNNGTVRFNMGNHATSLVFNENLLIRNGNVALSATAGQVQVTVKKKLKMEQGRLALKQAAGQASFAIAGDFIQSGGQIILYDQSSEISSLPVRMEVAGRFIQTGGQLNLCNHSMSSQPVTLSILSPEVVLNGNAAIVRSGNNYGLMVFAHQGTCTFKRLSGTHLISQVKIILESGCRLHLAAGNLQLSSSQSKTIDMLQIKDGAVLDAGESKIFSNMQFPYCGIRLEDGGRLRLMNENGFFNGTESGCLNAAGNMDYFLSPASIIEYCGIDDQWITGHQHVGAALPQHKYGILEINLQGRQNKKVRLTDPEVVVRRSLILTRGELQLNGNNLILESGSPDALAYTHGYVNARPVNLSSPGYVVCRNLSTGRHVIPFGETDREILPFVFHLKSGAGKSMQIMTYSTDTNNQPFPVVHPPINGLFRHGKEISVSDVIDRYYVIHANGIKADVELSYSAAENTLQTSDDRLSIQQWKDGKWSSSFGYGKRHPGGGTVTARNVSQFGVWIISTPFDQPAESFLSFEATSHEKTVTLNWEIISSINPPYQFQIQRAFSTSPFQPIATLTDNTDDKTMFSYTDEPTTDGEYTYRILLTHGSYNEFSEPRKVVIGETSEEPVTILSLKPNPFRNFFEITFTIPDEAIVTLSLTSSAGHQVFRESIKAIKGINTHKINLPDNLRSGIYVVAFGYNNRLLTEKLFKTE